jgi:2-polyprenyl-3-methyl-5-hydroxy-6-metoxy-1,4-benzoquinol methylase
MPDEHYDNPRLAELYDLDSGWSIDRDFYLSLAGSSPQRILDLGCGTGLLCKAYAAQNHEVTGVDPSTAMLEIGRRKPYGEKVEWVHAFAQTYRSDKLFDLIIMTGHAFQVLLSDEDVLATFATMREHIKPNGSIAFEARNPAIDWKEEWNYEIMLESNGNHVYISREFLVMENDRMFFELRYQFSDGGTFVSPSELRFLSRKGIEDRLIASGLRVEKLLGNWNAESFDEESSHEMIFIARATQ